MIEAFSPGSVTLFFEIKDDKKDPLKIGSRGVGICLSRGVRTKIQRSSKIEVYINGSREIQTIQEEISRSFGFTGRIESTVELPISQGFGMSGAAALSTSLAIAAFLGKTSLEAAHTAHIIEIKRKSGLGDVATQYEGGITLRRKEGIHPYGVLDRIIHPPLPLYLVIFEEKGIETKSILADPEKRRKIKKEGHRAMKKFLKAPSLENAIRIAREFAISTSLLSEEAKNFLELCANSTVAMIGNSAIIFGECKSSILEDYRVFKVGVGPRAHIVSFA